MTKKDLKTGMRVTLKSGRKLLVLLNVKHQYDRTTDVLVEYGVPTWFSLDGFNDDLTAKFDSDTIVKVEIPTHVYAITGTPGYKYETVWERETVKEMTVEEIQNILGYKIKVVESR